MAISPVFPTQGSFPLTSVRALPNVTVAFPGEHWSNRIAQGVIHPGDAVVEVNYNGKLAVRRATADDPVTVLAVAKRCVDIPDVNAGSIYNPALGPNDISNLPIQDGQYVHAYYSGVFVLSVATPRAWAPGELVSWDPAAARPTGKDDVATGAWVLAPVDVNTNPDVTKAFFSVQEFRPYSADGNEGLLTVKTLHRGQF